MLFLSLSIAITAFIFSNSLQSGEISGNQSDFFVDAFDNALSFFGISADTQILGVIIRKAAHFTEYFALGLTSSLFLSVFERKPLYTISPIYALVIAICDEFIMQSVTEGRAPRWTDVIIDLSGAVIAGLIIYLIKNRKQKV